MKPFRRFFKSAALLLPILAGCAGLQPVRSAEEQAAEDVPNAVTPERIATLPAAERAAWQEYYDRSAAHLREEKAVLAAEVKAAGLKEPLPAPGNSGFGAFSIARKKPASWFGSDEARKMADAAVSFQTPSGGWSKGVEFDQGLRKPGMHWTLKADGWYYVGTFDNNVFMGSMTSLAKIYQATKDPKHSAAFLKGLDYIFDAQFPNGGWPQNYPLAGGYHDEVTYNDNAMTNIVGLLRDVANGQPEYSFVDEARRAKARTAMEAGLRCILKTQIVQNGKLTAWCAQYDPITLLPAAARKFEVASLSGWESADIVRFLMSIESPTPEIKNAIESAVAWFESMKITGFEVVSSKNAEGGTAFTLVPNPNAKPLWARFYELGTGRPIFVTREPKVYYNLSDLDQSGPGKGYNWYVTQPQSLLDNDYPKWRTRVSALTAGKSSH
jgi:PelA/Pel-15E family pectate lyase